MIRKDRKRLALVFSALVYPGSGQLFQKRYGAGLFFLLLFTGSIGLFFIVTLVPLFQNLNHAVQGFYQDLEPMNIPNILLTFGLSLLVYILSLMDTAKANRRHAEPPHP